MKAKLSKDLLELRQAQKHLRQVLREPKDRALRRLADEVDAQRGTILKANAADLKRMSKKTPAAFMDRLELNAARIDSMISSLRSVAELDDPVGEFIEQKTLDNGLRLHKVRAPLGIIFIIFEARPNVITEAFSLAFKAGNSVILRGGRDSKNTSAVIYQIMRKVLSVEGFKKNPFLGLEDYAHRLVDDLLARNDLIDIVVPRGGSKMIEHIQKRARMPIIKNDRGLCHAYVHSDANLEMALNVITNAKTQRPGVCNALETVLVHKDISAEFIPKLYFATNSKALAWRLDPASLKLLRGQARVKAAKTSDWDTEHLDLILNCRVVNDIEMAIAHIEKHGSKHSEAIITEEEFLARRFQAEVDAAVVYWNASTRFTDGFEFGLGGELGISTQKLHVRGPVGLRELTSPRWLIDGKGQTRA